MASGTEFPFSARLVGERDHRERRVFESGSEDVLDKRQINSFEDR